MTEAFVLILSRKIFGYWNNVALCVRFIKFLTLLGRGAALAYGQSRVSLARRVVSLASGHLLEWYDYSLYGTFAVVIATVLFPPSHDPATPIIRFFLVYAVGLIIRPFSSIIFAHMGDRGGRRRPLLVTFLLMGAGTLLTGVIPSYAQIGLAAPALLLVARVLQGLGAGGELGGIGSYLSEISGPRNRGFVTAWQNFFIVGANLLGVVTGVILTSFDKSFVYSVGWRIPFILCGVLFIPVLWYLRRQLPESELFVKVKQDQKVVRVPLAKTFSRDLKPSLLVLFSTVGGTVIFYFIFTYLPSYLVTTTKLTLHDSLIVTAVGLAVITFMTPVWGYVSDRVQNRKVFGVISAASWVVLPYPVLLMFQTGNLAVVALGSALMSFFASLFEGIVIAWFSESFPTNTRYNGFVPYNIAIAYFGGFTPLISATLIAYTKNSISPVYWIVSASIVSLVAVVFMRDTGKLGMLTDDTSIYSQPKQETKTTSPGSER